ncbi:MAG: hypothetical protein ACKOA2_00060, partial [Ilumatobacteraceae bacterium]
NDQPDAVRAGSGGRVPVVVAETTSGVVVLLGPDELDECHGSVDQLMDRISQAAATHGLAW